MFRLNDFGVRVLKFYREVYLFLTIGLSTLSVPDEGFSRNVLCALNLISTFYYYQHCYTRRQSIFTLAYLLTVNIYIHNQIQLGR